VFNTVGFYNSLIAPYRNIAVNTNPVLLTRYQQLLHQVDEMFYRATIAKDLFRIVFVIEPDEHITKQCIIA
jgi:hypothetical protein